MKVLFDTNVWLDIILSREGFWEASLTALYDCIDEDDDLCVIATSLKDVLSRRAAEGRQCRLRVGRAHA